MVNSEKDAEIALQVSNALTKALLQYRLKSLSNSAAGLTKTTTSRQTTSSRQAIRETEKKKESHRGKHLAVSFTFVRELHGPFLCPLEFPSTFWSHFQLACKTTSSQLHRGKDCLLDAVVVDLVVHCILIKKNWWSSCL